MSVSSSSKRSDDPEKKIPKSRRFQNRKYESLDDEEDLETSVETTTTSSVQQVSEISNDETLKTDNRSDTLDKIEEMESSVSVSKSLDDDISNVDLEEKDASKEVSTSSSSSSGSYSETQSILMDKEEPINKKYESIKSALDSIIDSTDDKPDMKMSPYFSKLLCTILDEAVDQLGILGCLEQLSPPSIKDSFGSLDERLQDYSHEDPVVDSETGISYENILKEKAENKIYEDGSFIRECIMYVRDNVMKTNSCKVFANVVEAILHKKFEEDELIAEERKNTAMMEALEHEIQTEDIESLHKLQELDEQIAELRDKLENKQMEYVLRERYCTNWAKSLVEQHGFKYKELQEEMKEMKIKYDRIIEKEIKANSEIELYFDEKDNKLEECLQEWQIKYDTDLEAGRNEIQILEAQTEEQQKEYLQVKEEYDRMKKVIDDGKANRERKRKEEERLEMLNKKATKIQAWWRGMMVRHKLGPFNPKKGKKGKGKEKKPGKKKK